MKQGEYARTEDWALEKNKREEMEGNREDRTRDNGLGNKEKENYRLEWRGFKEPREWRSSYFISMSTFRCYRDNATG